MTERIYWPAIFAFFTSVASRTVRFPRSRPSSSCMAELSQNGLLRGACHPAALRADRVARNDDETSDRYRVFQNATTRRAVEGIRRA